MNKKINLKSKVKSLAKDVIKWSKNDFGLTTDEQYQLRYNMCKACEFWDPTGFNSTGTCLKCGCSTVVKLKLVSTECPLIPPKWKAIT